MYVSVSEDSVAALLTCQRGRATCGSLCLLVFAFFLLFYWRSLRDWGVPVSTAKLEGRLAARGVMDLDTSHVALTDVGLAARLLSLVVLPPEGKSTTASWS